MQKMRRKEREISSEDALQLFEKCEYAILATVNKDNTPYCVPVSPVLIDGVIYVHGALEGQKINNIKINPNVCLTCVGQTKLLPMKFSTDYESAVIYGKAEVIDSEALKRLALVEICKKFAAENIENADNYICKLIDKTSILKITIEAITGKAAKRL